MTALREEGGGEGRLMCLCETLGQRRRRRRRRMAACDVSRLLCPRLPEWTQRSSARSDASLCSETLRSCRCELEQNGGWPPALPLVTSATLPESCEPACK